MDDSYAPTTGTGGTLVERMKGAALLDIDTYETVEHDQTATGQAAAVVAMVAVAQAIGLSGDGLFSAVGGAVGALVAWLLWAGITYVVGDKLFGGEATWGELLRTLGFAQAPGILAIIAILPLMGGPVGLVTGLWMMVTAFVAVRQALDIGNLKTFVTIVVAAIANGILRAILF